MRKERHLLRQPLRLSEQMQPIRPQEPDTKPAQPGACLPTPPHPTHSQDTITEDTQHVREDGAPPETCCSPSPTPGITCAEHLARHLLQEGWDLSLHHSVPLVPVPVVVVLLDLLFPQLVLLDHELAESRKASWVTTMKARHSLTTVNSQL